MSSESDPDNREHVRSNVFLTASLRHGAASFAVRVRNLSATGALLDGDKLPITGSRIGLRRGTLSVTGTVVWQAANMRAIKFETTVMVAEWVKRTEHVGQQRVDAIMEALRSDAVGQGYREAELITDLAEELRQICQQMKALADMSPDLGALILRLDMIALKLETLSPLREGR